MRSIMTISLPKTMEKKVTRAVREGGFASTSEFFRMLIRKWQEDELVKEVRQAQEEMKMGKGKLLRSLEDLMD